MGSLVSVANGRSAMRAAEQAVSLIGLESVSKLSECAKE